MSQYNMKKNMRIHVCFVCFFFSEMVLSSFALAT